MGFDWLSLERNSNNFPQLFFKVSFISVDLSMSLVIIGQWFESKKLLWFCYINLILLYIIPIREKTFTLTIIIFLGIESSLFYLTDFVSFFFLSWIAIFIILLKDSIINKLISQWIDNNIEKKINSKFTDMLKINHWIILSALLHLLWNICQNISLKNRSYRGLFF